VYCARQQTEPASRHQGAAGAFFAGDPERLARFKRERRCSPRLNHAKSIGGNTWPGRSNGVHYWCWSSSRAKRSPNGLKHAALECPRRWGSAGRSPRLWRRRHEKGIIHRDLKPPNVKITRKGKLRFWTSVWRKLRAGAGRSGLFRNRRPNRRHERRQDPRYSGIYEPGAGAREAIDKQQTSGRSAACSMRC